MKNNFIKLVALSCFVVCMFIVSSNTASAESLSVEQKHYNVGDIVKVKLYVDEDNCSGVSGYLYYYTDIFEEISYENVDVAITGSWSIVYASHINKLTVLKSGGTYVPVGRGGLILTINLKVKKAFDSTTVALLGFEMDSEPNYIEDIDLDIRIVNSASTGLPNTLAQDNLNIYILLLGISSSVTASVYYVRKKYIA